MGRRRGEINEMCMACGTLVVVTGGRRWPGSVRFPVLVGLALLLVLAGGAGFTGGAGLTEVSHAGTCSNEARRVEQGSTYLPDCRAYELVTPAEKGATQALVFNGVSGTNAIPAEGGERLALESEAFLGENPGSHGTHVVFSRGASGWEMTSLQPAGAGEANLKLDVFSPELTQVGVEVFSETGRTAGRAPTQAFEVGPPGGPYSEVATTSSKSTEEGKHELERLVGASRDFSHVVLSSLDDSLLPSGVGTADPGTPSLYDWVDGRLHIVNVTSGGTLESECGAVLGDGRASGEPDDRRAVWGEGSSSKIFFTSPARTDQGQIEGPGCTGENENPHRLYMRVDDSETVEVSAPQPKEGEVGFKPPCDPGTWSAEYQGASADGSEVFFATESELTPDATGCHSGEGDNELYEYNTVTRKLTRISRGEQGTPEANAEGHVKTGEAPAVVSEDGSAVYFLADGRLTENAVENPGAEQLYRYDTVTGKIRLVAQYERPHAQGEHGYATPNGEFFLFPSQGVIGEPRGQGHNHNEMYLYDNADGSVKCVSCGSGEVAPAFGEVQTGGGEHAGVLAGEVNWTPPFMSMSGDGRYVFFQTTARLVPQATNNAQDVYEWEADGTGGCTESNGCTRLITSGTNEYESVLLGASQDGSNVFFATSAALVPQDVDTQPDVYDARIDGGFAAPAAPVRCSGEACRLIPSAPPVISTPLSATFSGVGNLVPTSEPTSVAKSKSPSRAQKLSEALRACEKKPKKGRAKCKAQARKRYGAKAAKDTGRGGR
jgi:hypothetical protein